MRPNPLFVSARGAAREFAMRDADFRAIVEIVHAHTGIVLGEHKRELVYSRLARRLRALGLETFERYVADLSNNPGELGELVNALTTNHTRFFREPHHFDFLAELAARTWRARREPPRIWSAGCSTGEEPYTIAMTLQRAMGTSPFKILATDIDTAVLERARAGLYPETAFAGAPAVAYQPFVETTDDGLRIKDAVRDKIAFKRLNLLGPWPMTRAFDAIFCRNVIIYFDGPTKTNLVARFADALVADGHLLLGHSETTQGCAALRTVGRTIHRRTSGGGE